MDSLGGVFFRHAGLTFGTQCSAGDGANPANVAAGQRVVLGDGEKEKRKRVAGWNTFPPIILVG